MTVHRLEKSDYASLQKAKAAKPQVVVISVDAEGDGCFLKLGRSDRPGEVIGFLPITAEMAVKARETIDALTENA